MLVGMVEGLLLLLVVLARGSGGRFFEAAPVLIPLLTWLMGC